MYLSSFQQNISIHIKYHKYVHVHQTTAADTISTRNIVPTKLTLSQTTLVFFFTLAKRPFENFGETKENRYPTFSGFSTMFYTAQILVSPKFCCLGKGNNLSNVLFTSADTSMQVDGQQ